jgi:hypothetical protein
MDDEVAVDFVLSRLATQSLTEHLAQPELAEFVRLVRSGKEIAAAQQYQQATGARLPQCHFAVQVARRFSG